LKPIEINLRMLMDPDNYIKIAIVFGGISLFIILISVCIVYRTTFFRWCCSSAIVVPENINTENINTENINTYA
jgi:hypothetical protein